MANSQLQVLILLVTLALIRSPAAAAAVGNGTQPPTSCKRKCGDIEVPFPFGLKSDTVDSGCYRTPGGFGLTCNQSYSPAKLFAGDFEVTGISISSAQMVWLARLSYICFNSTSATYSEMRTSNNSFARFRLSNTENVFVAIGCDTMARYRIGNRSFGGCISGCNSPENAADGVCSGVGCCQTPIPEDIKSYVSTFNLRPNGSDIYKFNPCSYSFIVQKSNYTFRTSDLASMDKKRRFPMVMDWAIRDDNLTCAKARKNTTSYACVSQHSDCLDSTNGAGYICNCSQGYEGNPYLNGGCTDIDECASRDDNKYPCRGTCRNLPGGYDCVCEKGFRSDDPFTQNCTKIESSGELSLTFKLLIGIASGVALLFIIGLTCGLGVQRRKIKKLREKCFERNGGVFLQHALSSDQRTTFKIFSMAELEKATNGFDEGQILGQGGYGTVYRGKLEDGRTVAIKRSMVIDERNGREFANELLILSEINHRNIVKILGCCLDNEVPMLVYEFISRGTLFDYIHNPGQAISFDARLRIATEAADALKYLHTDASPPILHGDVKSSNILLDGNHTAKVSDFGTSTLAPKDKTQFATLVQGTYGYLDPEYMMNGYLTDKSDVFSFGVILAEILTRRMPFTFDASTETAERSLAMNFISCATRDRLEEILDGEILQGGGVTDEVVRFAEIALRCLNIKGEDRPSMKEVAMELASVKGVQRHPWVPSHSEEVEQLLVRAIGSNLETGTIDHEIFGIEGGR